MPKILKTIGFYLVTTQPVFTCSKSNIGNTRTIFEICSKLKEGRQRHCSCVFIVYFDRFHTFFWGFHC